jgi:hypothetical protein
MHDSQQIFIPQSFTELFKDPLRPHAKLSEPFSHISARYDLCEDMAQMVCQTALNMMGSLNITEQDVIERILQGLSLDESVVTSPEARWVVQRMAELLNWDIPNIYPLLIDLQTQLLKKEPASDGLTP